MADVAVRLLGAFEVEVGGDAVDERSWRLRKARSLVKLLALEPGARLHSEQAMDLLWPELDATAARNNLHQAVHAARRVLGPERLTLRDGMLALDGVTPDVDEFERAAADARAAASPEPYEAALALYRGELLPEDRYEPWAETRRVALRELYVALSLELAALHGSQRPIEQIAALQRALAADPLNEAAHRALMLAYDGSGRRQEALAQYGRLRQALRDRLAADPDPDTRELYRTLLAAGERTRPSQRSHLPPQLTSFIGRERELADIGRLLARSRLLTLTGPGGSGKTRLALEAAGRAGADGPDGAWFVELSGIFDGALVAETAATAVGIRVPSRRAAAEALAEHLAGRRALLVLDTCEHLLEACASLAETLLAGSPGVTVLATSREPLRCRGETTWRVPGLDVPPLSAELDAIGRSESVQLFLARATTAAPGFELSAENAADVATICFRLDGMPLAIELAAARVGLLEPAEIAARLEGSLDVLTSGNRTALTRQQTLRATIAWSHDLLRPDEQLLFRRLAVFAGSFALDAAEYVCADATLAEREVLDILGRLVDKSLVIVDDAPGARYRMLDTIRQFAAEQLTASGERDTFETRHRAWAQRLAEAHDPATLRGAANRSLATLELDHDNLRAALATGARNDPDAALRLALTTWRFWLDRNYFTEGSRHLAAVLEAASAPTEQRAHALLAAAALDLRRGDVPRIAARRREAVDLARRLCEPLRAADIVHRAALIAVQHASAAEAEALAEEALGMLDNSSVDALALRASALHASALLPFYGGDLVEARRRIEASLELLARVPTTYEPFFEGMTQGFVVLPEGPEGRLRPYFEQTIMLFHRFGREQARALALANLAAVERSEGRRDEARALLDDALDRFRLAGDRSGEALALTGLASWARSFGEPDAGEAWIREALELRRADGDQRALGMTENAFAVLLAAAGRLEPARSLFQAIYDRFRAADDAPGTGGVLVNWGIAEERAGELVRAAELLERGASVWAEQVRGHLPGWAWFAAADMRLALGDDAEARAAIGRAHSIFRLVGDERGRGATEEHAAAAKTALSARKASPP